MMRSGLPVCTTDSKSGKSSLRPVRGGDAVRLVAVRFRTHVLQKPPHRVELRAKTGPVSGFQVRNCLIVVLERFLRPICREACERPCHCSARNRRRGAGFHEERRQCLGERLLHYHLLAIGCDHALELWQVSLHRTQIERRYMKRIEFSIGITSKLPRITREPNWFHSGSGWERS